MTRRQSGERLAAKRAVTAQGRAGPLLPVRAAVRPMQLVLGGAREQEGSGCSVPNDRCRLSRASHLLERVLELAAGPWQAPPAPPAPPRPAGPARTACRLSVKATGGPPQPQAHSTWHRGLAVAGPMGCARCGGHLIAHRRCQFCNGLRPHLPTSATNSANVGLCVDGGTRGAAHLHHRPRPPGADSCLAGARLASRLSHLFTAGFTF